MGLIDAIIFLLKGLISFGCILGFFINSKAIFDGFLEDQTTVSSEVDDMEELGFQAPTMTICADKPFKNLSWDNLTYETYDSNTLDVGEIIKDVNFITVDNKLKTDAASIKVLYTVDKGRCYILDFKEKVSTIEIT